MQEQIVMGIVTLPLSKSKVKHIQKQKLDEQTNIEIQELIKKTTYFGKQYKDWLKSVGIKVVPITLNDSDKKHRQQLSYLDGLLFTGGAADQFFAFKKQQVPTFYLQKVHFLIKEAQKINEDERFFLVWGICLGFQSIIQQLLFKNLRTQVNNNVKDYQEAGTQVKETDLTKWLEDPELFSERMFYFNQKYAILSKAFQNNSKLNHCLKVVVEKKLGNFKYPVFVQFKEYPFYLILFHIEKPFPIDDPDLDKKRKINRLKYAMFIKEQILRNSNRQKFKQKQIPDNLFQEPYYQKHNPFYHDIEYFFYNSTQEALQSLFGKKLEELKIIQLPSKKHSLYIFVYVLIFIKFIDYHYLNVKQSFLKSTNSIVILFVIQDSFNILFAERQLIYVQIQSFMLQPHWLYTF